MFLRLCVAYSLSVLHFLLSCPYPPFFCMPHLDSFSLSYLSDAHGFPRLLSFDRALLLSSFFIPFPAFFYSRIGVLLVYIVLSSSVARGHASDRGK